MLRLLCEGAQGRPRFIFVRLAPVGRRIAGKRESTQVSPDQKSPGSAPGPQACVGSSGSCLALHSPLFPFDLSSCLFPCSSFRAGCQNTHSVACDVAGCALSGSRFGALLPRTSPSARSIALLPLTRNQLCWQKPRRHALCVVQSTALRISAPTQL